MTDRRDAHVDLHTDLPHPARVYDYLLGGKTHFEADRLTAEYGLRLIPSGRNGPVENRAFMTRAVRHLAKEAGIRQFLDIGTGIPSSPNVHEVAQEVDPAARIVYVDNDPIVLVHARALMRSTPQGATRYVDADMRDPDDVIGQVRKADVFDLDQPIGLLLVAVMHLLRNLDQAYESTSRLVDAMPAGSFLVLSHLTDELAYERMHALSTAYAARGLMLVPRDRAQIEAFFTGLKLVRPGLVYVNRWRPDPPRPADDPEYDATVSILGAVARKPD
jgi:hypothetical protein